MSRVNLSRLAPYVALAVAVLGCSPDGKAPTAPEGGGLLPPAAGTNALDLFLVAGQSNAVGRGDSVLSIRVPLDHGYEWSPLMNRLTDGNDPIANAATGSAWPAFLKRWYELTGRRAVIVGAAKGGSAQHYLATQGSSDDWDDPARGGTLYAAAVARLDSALASLPTQGYTPVFRGILWDQGGRDAKAIGAGDIGITDYRSAFEAMIGRFRARYGRTTAMWIVRLGRESAGDRPGWTEVRRIQDEVAAADPYAWIVFENAIDFPAEGKMADEVHYNQAGYNEIGRVAAENAAAAIFGARR